MITNIRELVEGEQSRTGKCCENRYNVEALLTLPRSDRASPRKLERKIRVLSSSVKSFARRGALQCTLRTLASQSRQSAELKVHFELTNVLDVLPDMIVQFCEQPLTEGPIVKEKAAHLQGFLLLHD
jgi:hypothetical protein